MAQNNKDEFPLNTGLESQISRQTARHLPSFFRTDPNKKFLGGTLDPLTQPGKLARINSYIGRRDIPNYSFDDNYIEENTNSRQSYQLEPSFVYDDSVTGKVNWYADYIDYMNSLKYFGAFTGNHSNLNKSESYSWDPHIDWDKFVNYREYYWLPNGPDAITIYGEKDAIVSEYTVSSRRDNDNIAYIFSTDELVANPTLTLYKGQTYEFKINTKGSPFCIKTRPETGPSYFYNTGINKQSVENGTMIFTVPLEAPTVLYYINANDANSVGLIEIKDILEATHLDVEATILGKKNYEIVGLVKFINGLKIKFAGNVLPKKYSKDYWYVEGVGDKIRLVNSKDLDSPVTYGDTVESPFDATPFDSLPWETAENYSATKDYIVINRVCKDRNNWSRNNRWFHINVINTTATVNNQSALFDQKQRAIRPIIEFNSNIKLFNNGWIAKQDVDLIDTTTTDVFSTIEGTTEYWIDEEKIYPGYRILFTADTDITVNGRIFQVVKIFNANENKDQITLQSVEDSEPIEGQVVYAKRGTANKGCSYYYQDNIWKQSQKKTSLNQSPLFDLFDESYNSFSDKTAYPYNNFTGNKIFSYQIGTGTTDPELGFPLSHRAIDNVGDIEFSFDLQKQFWTYQENSIVTPLNSYEGFVRKFNDDDTFSYSNGWIRTYKNLEQPAVRVLKIITETDLIPIDVYDNSASLLGLSVRVYVNNKKVDPTTISFEIIQGYYYIRFASTLSVGSKVVYKVTSTSNKNAKGYYEIPHNWQNNPLNETVDSFTFGEVTDHVSTIIDNIISFSGNFPGISNLANLGTVAHYGQRFLQHAGSMPLAVFALTDKHANVVKALRYTAKKYSIFKKEFIRLATITSVDGTPAEIVDSILSDYASAKYLDQSAFYYSDMVAAGAASVRNYTVVDPRLPVFVIDKIFTPMTSDKRQVLVYLNDVQLIYGIDYKFETTDAFVIILSPLKIGDRISINDYSNTDGRSYIPYTPSKLGLYPSYIPRIYIDDTYATPTKVIQGHDGSIIVGYNDYRDDLILELERRMFNSRKVNYDPLIFNIDDVIGGYYRKTDFSKNEINSILLGDFLRWNSVADLDLNSNDYYVEENSFTYNYNTSVTPDGAESLYGYWRGVYKYFYDTDRPHTCPWEMQGFTIKPDWWDTVYGEAPYTDQNLIMWDNIEKGVIADPSYMRTNLRYVRPGLSKYIPVDSDGNLCSPIDSSLAQSFSLVNAKDDYVFGDQAPVETAWRRSSEFPYSIVAAMCVLRGSEFIGKMWDRFTIKRNIAGQIYSTNSGLKIQPKNLTFPNVPLGNPNDPTVSVSVTSGLVNFIEEYLFDAKYANMDLYKETLKSLDAKLSYRIGGFTSKEQINVLLDSRSPNATGTIFLPPENYKIFYNKSAPVDTISYSGVIIEKIGTSYPLWVSNQNYRSGSRVTFQGDIYHCILNHVSSNSSNLTTVERFYQDSNYWNKETLQKIGYKIRGYDSEKNYFEVFGFRPNQTDPTIDVGGISESYVSWTTNKFYNKDQIMRLDNTGFYRSKYSHTSSKLNFEEDASKWTPLAKLPITGGVSVTRRTNFGNSPIKINYGTVFPNVQDVVDFLLGYQKRLEYWGFSFDDYSKDLDVPLTWLTSAKEFMFWTLQNWAAGAVITLSPSSNKISFVPVIQASIDNTDTDFYDYSIFKADGAPLKADLTDIYREGPGFVIKPAVETNDGIFHIRTNLVYKEHVILFDNRSIFNDVLYDQVPGYRQGRLKILGYKTMNWDGSYTSPGFMYDDANIKSWYPNTDYMIGDIVKFKSYYFTALVKVLGKNDFDYNDWKQLDSAPVAGLVPNFDYKIEQFRDFYSLDASNFDSTQESLARHLIGYQPRQYLANIINDEVSQYKFYQGFIKEKGTLNSITKLFDVLRASGWSTIDIKEEWAFKVGQYGASDAYSEIEFSLNEEKFLHNPQNINLTQNVKEFSDLSIYNVTANEISIKPSSYNSKPFKTSKIDTTQNNYGIFKYQVAGYVKEEDVDHIVINEAALLNYDITLFNEKDKIWLGYTSNNDWNVYEYINTNILITGWSVSDNIVSLECNVIPDVSINDIIVLSNLDSLDGSYKIQSVYNNIIEIFTFNSTIFTIQDNVTSGIVHLMKPSRFSSLTDVSANRYNTKDIRGEIVWVDKDKNDKWLVLENQDSFTKSELPSRYNIDEQAYGYEVKLSADNKWMFVTCLNYKSGIVLVYNRTMIKTSWNFVQPLTLPDKFLYNLTPSSNSTSKFGISIDVTEDGSVVVIGSTDATCLTYDADYYNSYGVYIGVDVGPQSNKVNQGIAVVFVYNTVRTIYDLDVVIGSYNQTDNERFGSKVKIANDGTNLWLFVASKNYNSDAGRVQIFRKTDGYWQSNPDALTLGYPGSASDMKGYDLDCNSDATRIVVSAPYAQNSKSKSGSVFVYKRSGYVFDLIANINSETLISEVPDDVNVNTYLDNEDYFGYSVAITNDSLFISAPGHDTSGANVGAVYNFTLTDSTDFNKAYRLTQLILPPIVNTNERFGTKLSVNPSNNVLGISAIGSNSLVQLTYDNYSKRVSSLSYELDPNSDKIIGTTFDNNSTSFYDHVPYTGAVYVYNRFDDNFIYGDRLTPSEFLESDDKFGSSISVTDNTIAVGTPSKFVVDAVLNTRERQGTVFVFDYSELSWKVNQSQDSVIDISKFKKAFIYDTKKNTLIQNLDFYDPLKGRIPSIADQELKYQTYYDPAVYQYGVPTEVSVDESTPWTDEHVGELWWDLSKVKFTWYEQGDSTFRNNNWGRIFTGCTIDIYEWVETTYLPSKWAELADTETGIALGISGIPKDIDNFTWSSKFKYDPISGSKTTLYYYWVKNKNVVPNIHNRQLSCADVAKLILDPKSQGYQYVCITSENTLSLSNISNKLVDTDVSLNLQFYEVDNTELLTHREYALIATDDPNAIIPKSIETKWFDSLIGSNIHGQALPDMKLNKKQRYGNLNSPRQSWFINRYEALKQLFEYVNSILAKNVIVEDINFANLKKNDPAPTLNSGEIDTIIDVTYELKFIGTVKLRTAKLTVQVIDGRITNVFINDSGYGYGCNKEYSHNEFGVPTSWYGPNVKIIGTGTGAKIQTVINSNGEIIRAIIIKSGEQYDTNTNNLIRTQVVVRDYTVLINSDEEANNSWSIYYWKSSTTEWIRNRTQSFDVTRYWKYKDWYLEGYGLSADISYQVERTVDLNGLDAKDGDIVKINNVGYGNWILLQRTQVTNNPDFTVDYRVVGRQNGTIEFSDKLYNLNKNLGFDTNYSYDLSYYDQSTTTELRIILETLRDSILINNLRQEYVKMFFNSVYYVLSEQLYTDWCFKTSFLKVNHVVGTLRQRITFQSDEAASYESFIEEAKPYKTKVREWISSYNSQDNSDVVISDFDLPSYYNVDRNSIETTTISSDNVEFYPWKNWLDNHTYQVTDIILTFKGNNYTNTPMVIISGGGGSGAKASAYIANGSIYRIVIDNPGTGYTSVPTVFISGDNGNIASTRATAYARIGKTLTRTNLVGMKFDRLSPQKEISNFRYTDFFDGTGSKKEFKLTFAPEIEKNNFTILVNNIEYYGSQYSISILETPHDSYTALEGYIVFAQAPITGKNNIEVTYNKNIKLFSATDRIDYAYKPTAGQFGIDYVYNPVTNNFDKSFNQLMTGVDYSGVTVTSIDFDVTGGWGVLDWDVSAWDGIITSNDDQVEIVTGNPPNRTYTLEYIPLVGEEINVYQKNDQKNIRLNYNFQGNGLVNTITIPSNITLSENDLLTFRKSTSDGSILITDRSLIDSTISGGELTTYSSAYGINAEDLIIDGADFVTPDTSHGPEELVPGQIFDTLSIKVYHTPSSGGPNVYVYNYTGDGITAVFNIDQIPGSEKSLIAIVNNISVDFSIDFMDKTVTLVDVPDNESKIVFAVFDTAGYDILDKKIIIGNGSTQEFLTAAAYVRDSVTVYVTVDGVEVGATIKASDKTYEIAGNVLVTLDDIPANDSIVQIIVFSGNFKKYSKMLTEHITLVSGQRSYTLTNIPSVKTPLSANVFVLVDDEYLLAPNYKNYIYNGNSLEIVDNRYQAYSLKQENINVYRNGVKLNPSTDFVFNSANNLVSLTSTANAVNSDEITVEILKTYDYQIIGNQLIINNDYDLTDKNTIKVTTFTNHDIVKMKRVSKGFSFATGFDLLGFDIFSSPFRINTSGIFDLPNPVSNTSGVFVVLNRKILAQNIDYVILDNKKQIRVVLPITLTSSDYIEIITTNNQTVRPSFGFNIFKDMLNRVTYKALDKTKVTTLANDFTTNDTSITVTDGSVLTSVLNDQKVGTRIPGVIEINGERIEYFVKNGNTISQLRRATLGTSINNFVSAGTLVYDIGSKLTIPYTDTEIKRTAHGDGITKDFILDFVPKKTVNASWYRSTISSNFGQCDMIEVYVAGRRLVKTPTFIYDQTKGQDSYKGLADKQIEAEFSVDGVNKSVRLTVAPAVGELVVIIAKQGKKWQKYEETSPLIFSNTAVAKFLNTREVDLPK